MVHGYHVIWGTYGFWLPNDPRGSWSDFVYAWELARFGRATRSAERVDVEPSSYAAWRAEARQALKYPPVTLSGIQALAVGRAIGRFVRDNGLNVWACAILPEHVHMVLGRHRYAVEQVVNLLKGTAQRWLRDAGLHPLAGYRTDRGRLPSMWAEKRWKAYLDTTEAIENAVHYVEENPDREGKPRQSWPFVRAFDGLDIGGWTTYY